MTVLASSGGGAGGLGKASGSLAAARWVNAEDRPVLLKIGNSGFSAALQPQPGRHGRHRAAARPSPPACRRAAPSHPHRSHPLLPPLVSISGPRRRRHYLQASACAGCLATSTAPPPPLWHAADDFSCPSLRPSAAAWFPPLRHGLLPGRYPAVAVVWLPPSNGFVNQAQRRQGQRRLISVCRQALALPRHSLCHWTCPCPRTPLSSARRRSRTPLPLEGGAGPSERPRHLPSLPYPDFFDNTFPCSVPPAFLSTLRAALPAVARAATVPVSVLVTKAGAARRQTNGGAEA